MFSAERRNQVLGRLYCGAESSMESVSVESYEFEMTCCTVHRDPGTV